MDVVVIDIREYYGTATCCICGTETPSHWGVPVDSETGEIVANDFEGEWGGVPACRECHAAHDSGQHVGEYPRF
jgi:hypothetical protein